MSKKKNPLVEKIEEKIALANTRREFDECVKRQEDVSHIRTVCMVLGPYRNLTTLTAAIMFFHPNVQVLNHAAVRILPIKGANFFEGYTDRKFDDFVRFALHLSEGGERGRQGGSILHAHAFANDDAMRKAYEDRFGTAGAKDDPRCLFWKESMRVSNILHDSAKLSGLIGENSRLRFIMPVRNPIDCAISNIRVKHVQYFEGLEDRSLETVIDFILKELAWFLDREREHPGRFFHFTQNEMSRETLSRLAAFLDLPADERWIDDTLAQWNLKASYDVEPAVRKHYESSVRSILADHPETMRRLLEMV